MSKHVMYAYLALPSPNFVRGDFFLLRKNARRNRIDFKFYVCVYNKLIKVIKEWVHGVAR